MKPMEMVLPKLHGVKRSGQNYMACCPAHDDHKPSLSISHGHNGGVVMHCHAGCKNSDIVAAMGLTMRDLMPQTVTTSPLPGRPGKPSPQTSVPRLPPDRTTTPPIVFPTQQLAIDALEQRPGKHACQWRYENDQKQLVRVVLRWNYPDGSKRDIRPIIKTTDGWCIKGATAPATGWTLYCLPELLEHPGERVFVCEGEKTADAVWTVGLLATTSPQGCSGASKADWRELAGREVVILPDADESGETYAKAVTVCLMSLSPPAKVRVVRLPELVFGSGHDMVEFAQLRGGDALAIKAELEAMAEAADVVAPTSSDTVRHDNDTLPVRPGPEPFKPFPLDALPRQMASYCHDGAKAIGCDASYIALPMLAEFASAIGNSRVIQLKNSWKEPSILWCVIIGLSGSTKSPALELAMRPARRWQDRKIKENNVKMAEYKRDQERFESLKATRRRSDKHTEVLPDEPKPPVCERSWMDDATIEAVITILQGNPRGVMLMQDELTTWLNFDRYSKGGGIVAKWLEMHGGRSVIVDRKTSETLYVRRAAVCVAGGIQPAVLARSIGQEYRDNGLLARLLMTMPPPKTKLWTEAEIDPSAEAAMVTLYERLRELQPAMDADGEPQPAVMKLSPQAKHVWIEFYNAHNKQMAMLDGELAAAWSKLEGYAARLALVIHMVRVISDETSSNDIDEVSMKAGIALSRWFSDEAKRVYAMLAGGENDCKLQKWVERIQVQGGSVSVRKWHRMRSHKHSADAEAELAELVSAGWGKWEDPAPGPQGGRPPKRFVVTVTNPTITIELTDNGSPGGDSDDLVKDADADADANATADDDWGEI